MKDGDFLLGFIANDGMPEHGVMDELEGDHYRISLQDGDGEIV